MYIEEFEKNRSTGPRTPEGKAISSQNALKHGLACGRMLIEDENPDDFRALVADLEKDYEPANTIEALLIHDLAKFRWLTDRAIRYQQNLFYSGGSVDFAALPIFIRYENTNHRAFMNTLKSLQAIQKERKKLEREFVPPDEYDEEGNILSRIEFVNHEGKPFPKPTDYSKLPDFPASPPPLKVA